MADHQKISTDKKENWKLYYPEKGRINQYWLKRINGLKHMNFELRIFALSDFRYKLD
jgi:hypothetical protein